MEYNAWGDPPNPPEHEVNLVFTRMLAGPMDYTPGVLSLTGAGGKRIQSTVARQLALYVVLYSPIQMAADLPENYAKYPKPFQFIKDVPVDWSDTRVLNGEVGDYVTIARKDRNSDDWYLGAITDEQRAYAAGVAELPRRREELLRDDLSRRHGTRASKAMASRSRSRRGRCRATTRCNSSSRRAADRRFASRPNRQAAGRTRRPSLHRRSPNRSSTSNERSRTQTASVVLADLEHVFRVPGDPVRLRAAERECQPHLPDAGREHRRHPDPVDRRAADRADRATHRRLLLGSHLELAGPPAAVFPRGRVARVAGAHRHAALAGVVDGGGDALDPRRQHQHRHGAVPRFRRRSAARRGNGPPAISMQSFFIGVGAVVASMLPWIFAHAGVSNVGTGSGAARFPTRCAIRSTSAPWCWRRRCCGPSSRRASIRPASCMGLPTPRRTPKA